jgi:23S rRNA maturation-related 3'-5' exoribonuclease YhaM
MIQKIHASSALTKIQNDLVSQAFQEGFIEDDVVAMDGTHIEARDRLLRKRRKKRLLSSHLPKSADENPKQNERNGLKSNRNWKRIVPSLRKRLKNNFPSISLR